MVRLPLACALAVVLVLAGGAVEYDAITENFTPEVCSLGNRNGTWHCVAIFDSKRVVRIPFEQNLICALPTASPRCLLVPASASIWSAD